MSVWNIYDHAALAAQINRQKKHAWDLEKDIPWSIGVSPNHYLLPLDKDNIAFPGASSEQRLAISQLTGLIINSTIAEMEGVIKQMQGSAWEKLLRRYPVNPEMFQLGELFFEEEQKHSIAFSNYNDVFYKALGLDAELMRSLLPTAYGSIFLKTISLNSIQGGHAFWWVVASVEEVSIDIFNTIRPEKNHIDPLFFEVHRKHMEEEVRHHRYAFLMLSLIQRQQQLRDLLHRKTSLILAEIFSTHWVLTELTKIFKVKKYKKEHPFLDVLASSIPLFEKMNRLELAKRLMISVPYISQFLNTTGHAKTIKMAHSFDSLKIPWPKPYPSQTFTFQPKRV